MITNQKTTALGFGNSSPSQFKPPSEADIRLSAVRRELDNFANQKVYAPFGKPEGTPAIDAPTANTPDALPDCVFPTL